MSRPADSYRSARKNKQHGRADAGNTAPPARDDRKSFVPHAFAIVTSAMSRIRYEAKKAAAKEAEHQIIDEASDYWPKK